MTREIPWDGTSRKLFAGGWSIHFEMRVLNNGLWVTGGVYRTKIDNWRQSILMN